jgi:TPR repeat protein
MRLRKWLVLFLVFLFGGTLLMGESRDNQTIESTPDYFRIPENKLSKKTLYALRGNPEAAQRVAHHYIAGMDDFYKGVKWYIISTENGTLDAQYSLANILLDFSNNDNESRIRGIFWLYTMVNNGYRVEETADWLKGLNYNLDTAKPPDDSFFPDNYAQLSEIEITDCRVGALQGNKKAALLLGKYYSEVKVDSELSEYWYRIGAQNGSPECQYELGQILLSKDDELNNVRGNFWLRQAAQNGYNIE